MLGRNHVGQVGGGTALSHLLPSCSEVSFWEFSVPMGWVWSL